ncbi:MAG: hypothetical protein ACREQY_00485 [Candidatus Binatia bacterium]
MGASIETLTDFLHRPARVLKRVDREDVVLRRRGKPAIRLSLETRTAGTEVAAHVLADALGVMPELSRRLAGILQRRYPWLRFLPADARESFVREFIETLQACAAVGNPAHLDELLHSWKATAEIHADPVLHAALTRSLPASRGKRVPRPSGR